MTEQRVIIFDIEGNELAAITRLLDEAAIGWNAFVRNYQSEAYAEFIMSKPGHWTGPRIPQPHYSVERPRIGHRTPHYPEPLHHHKGKYRHD